MLNKLLKKDLSRNMRWLWILFVATIGLALVDRGCKELGANIAFFKILSIFLDSVYYALAVNVILQPFLRNFLNFTKSLYGDESYLTHTLPVTKNQIINAKFLTALIEIVCGFVCLVVSLLIMFVTPALFDGLQGLVTLIFGANVSAVVILLLFVLLVTVEFLMFISIIFFSIVIAYRAREKRILKTFLWTVALAFLAITILVVIMVIVLVCHGVDLTSNTLALSGSALLSIIITGITVYVAITVVFYFLTKRAFRQGVNVD